MTLAQVPSVELCPATALQDGGPAHVFDVLEHGEPLRAFALRHDGAPVGYLNRCAHVPAELDWQPGQFLDDTGRWIICAMHGAVYDPANGLCVGGPCAGKSLTPLHLQEREGRIYWYPHGPLAPQNNNSRR